MKFISYYVVLHNNNKNNKKEMLVSKIVYFLELYNQIYKPSLSLFKIFKIR